MPSFRRPLRVSLVVGGLCYLAEEWSPAGLTLPAAVLRCHSVQSLGRGTPHAATLRLHLPGGDEDHAVRFRLAGRLPSGVEIAFVQLAPTLRQALEAPETDGPGAEDAPSGLPSFAFGQLDAPAEDDRRLPLPSSENVLALTRERHTDPSEPPPSGAQERRQRSSLSRQEEAATERTVPLRLFIYALLAVGLLAGVGGWALS
ncbi:MAG: hypothetical protein R3362_01775 [Rhodothermales bacterium]|nr:hypothetical protein [Rhodothermales bacterium]